MVSPQLDVSVHGLMNSPGIDVQAELNSNRWNPGAAPVRPRVQSEDLTQNVSLKYKTKAVNPTQTTISAKSPVVISAPQYLSPISDSPGTSEPLTPPSMAPPTPKRVKTQHPKPTSYFSTTSCKYPFSFSLLRFKRTMVLD